jgi:MFS family permease
MKMIDRFPPIVKLLLISTFAMNMANFMVLTFLAIYLALQLQFTALQTGSVLAVMTVTSRALPFFFGLIADRYGFLNLMLIGLLIRSVGLLGFGWVETFPLALCCSFLIGLGIAVYEPSALAVYANQSAVLRKRIFPAHNQCLNLGAIVGPLIGGLLVPFGAPYLFGLSAGIFLLLAVFLLLFRKTEIRPQQPESGTLLAMNIVLRNKSFLYFAFSMVCFWLMFSQLTVALPLKMFSLTGDERYVSLVITINALTGLLFMFWFKRLYIRLPPLRLIQAGVLVMAVALIFVPLFVSPLWLFCCIILFTIGETLALPSTDLKVAEYSAQGNPAAYFGFFEFSYAIGAMLGSYLGTWSLTDANGGMMPWMLFGLSGVLCCYLLSYPLWMKSGREVKQKARNA